MRYLCLGYHDVDASKRLSSEEFTAIVSHCPEYDKELLASGRVRIVASLVEDEVVTVRTRGGEVTLTDGPCVESKEQVGSFFVLEASDLNDAVRIASRHPAARLGEDLGWAVEVRPIGSMEEYGGV